MHSMGMNRVYRMQEKSGVRCAGIGGSQVSALTMYAFAAATGRVLSGSLAAPVAVQGSTRAASSLAALSSRFALGTRLAGTRCAKLLVSGGSEVRSRGFALPPVMALERAVVAGGTGFIGSQLVRTLVDRGVDVTVLTRNAASARHLPAAVKAQPWAPDPLKAVGDDWVGWQSCLEDADLVVNLCGEPVVTRWTEAGKRSIIESRVKPTSALADAILKMPEDKRPKCVVSASGVGYYGVSEDARFTEDSSGGRDFLAVLSKDWEGAAKPIADAGVRLVIIRTGVVLGTSGGALARMLPAFKFFLGGPVGSGRQWVSWIHLDDLVAMYIRAGEDPTVSGVYNGSAPAPVNMNDMCASLARALNRPNLFPVPPIALKVLFGEGADVVLQGQHAAPKKWLSEGFEYKYGDIDTAMQAIAREA
jgi:uncharacterized protein